MNEINVLIVDDEKAIRRFLHTSLTAHGYKVHEAATGEQALLQAVNLKPELIILDLGLPDMTGIDVTRRIREWSEVPILILSVQDQETDKISALDAGADDYLTKPFSTGELMARMRAALRHVHPASETPVFTTGELEVNLATRVVRCRGEEISLTPTEYDILRLMVQHAGKVLTHQQLLRQVRGINYQTETHLLRVHMSNLRRKIEQDPTNPEYILTEAGVGYRLLDND